MDLSENADPQTSQGNCFSPVGVSMCLFKWETHENADSPTSQSRALRKKRKWFLTSVCSHASIQMGNL